MTHHQPLLDQALAGHHGTPPTTNGIPTWLAQQIELHTGATPGARNAQPVRCRHCHARILTGLDDDHAAWTARTNPNPTNTLGEALARLHGLWTYALRHNGRTYRLTRRDRWQITGQPAGTYTGPLRYDVLADHHCTLQLPAIASVHQPMARHLFTDQPPF